MRRKTCQIVQHLFDLHLAYALDKLLEAFISLTFRYIPTREPLYHFRDALRRDRTHCQSIGTSIMSPLPTQHNLEVRHRVIPRMAADAVKTKVGNVMLTAGIKTAADLDMQVLHGFIQGMTLFGE